MQGTYSNIPERNRGYKVYSVATVLWVQFMVLYSFNSDVECFVRLHQYCLQCMCAVYSVQCAVLTLGTRGGREQLGARAEFSVCVGK